MAKTATVFLLSLLMFVNASAAPACVDLIKLIAEAPPQVPNRVVETFRLTERVQIQHMSDTSKPTVVNLTAKPFSQNYEFATMDLMQMMVHTKSFALNDKNVLFKDELVLGVPLKDGYSLQATYEADGRAKPSFTIQSIEIVTPTGYAQKIAKDIVAKHEYVLVKETFELSADLYPTGREVKADLPLVVEGEALDRIKKMTPDLELFDKSELKKIAQEKTYSQMRRSFIAKKTKSLFNKYFIAAPFKTIANFLPTILLASAISWSITNISRDVEVVKPPPPPAWVQTSINHAAAKSIAPEVKILFNELKAEADAQFKAGAGENIVLSPSSLAADKYKFSDNHMTWVFENQPANGPKQTFIVLTEEVKGATNEPIKYLVLQVDPVKYKILIDYIRAQGHTLVKK